VMNQWAIMRYADMTGGIVALSLLGWGLFGVVDGLEKILCPWVNPGSS